MCASKHWNIQPFQGLFLQGFQDLGIQGGEIAVKQSLFDCKRNCGVVDVLGRQSKMDKLQIVEDIFETLFVLESVLDEVLDGLDIMLGLFFLVLDIASILLTKVLIQGSQGFFLGFIQLIQIGKPCVHQGDEILHFHLNSIPNIGRLREIFR
jgi:hypothetical protein